MKNTIKAICEWIFKTYSAHLPK